MQLQLQGQQRWALPARFRGLLVCCSLGGGRSGSVGRMGIQFFEEHTTSHLNTNKGRTFIMANRTLLLFFQSVVA